MNDCHLVEHLVIAFIFKMKIKAGNTNNISRSFTFLFLNIYLFISHSLVVRERSAVA